MISLRLPIAQAQERPVSLGVYSSPTDRLFMLLRGEQEKFREIPDLILGNRIPYETWTRMVRVDGVVALRNSARWADANALEIIILRSELGPDYEARASSNALAELKRTPENTIA